MGEKASRRVKTLSGFMKWAAQFRDGQYLFRGVPDETYDIVPSTYLRPQVGRDSEKLLKINKEYIRDARLRGHDEKNGRVLSDLELLAELQHFRAATCLIDFTYSAQVALWFACGSSRGNPNGKVYAVRVDDPVRFKKITPELLRENLDYFFNQTEQKGSRMYQWQPRPQNNRIIAQQSVFIFGSSQIDAEAECIILKGGKEDSLIALEKASGITEASLFSDFDGFARLRAYNQPYIEPDAHQYLQRGVEAEQEGRLDDALDYYSEVISLRPDNLTLARTYNNRGVVYGEKGEFDLGIEDFNEAIRLSPDNAYSYYTRGFAYANKGEVDLAIEDFSKAIEFNPNDADAYYNRGSAYIGTGNVVRAIDDYSQVIQLIPDHVEAYYNRGNAYRDRGEFEGSINDYTRVVELEPDHAYAYYNRAMVWLHLHNWEGAKADLAEAQNRGLDIIDFFGNSYESLADFEDKIKAELPEEIALMLMQQ